MKVIEMIDLSIDMFVDLEPVDDKICGCLIDPMYTTGEIRLGAFKNIHDGGSIHDVFVFTNKRIFAINVQDSTGKANVSFFPYKEITTFSVGTEGTNLDNGRSKKLEIWSSAFGNVKFMFVGHVNINNICRMMSECIVT